jgi:hypothetical protein
VRVIVAGLGANGRSCVIRDRDVQFGEVVPGLAAFGLFRTSETPPPTPPAGHGEFVDLGVAPGLCGWVLYRHDPRSERPMHYTHTLDFNIILEGSVELILDDGVHPLLPGDCVVTQGVDHAWRAGDLGCLMSGLAVGTAPAI